MQFDKLSAPSLKDMFIKQLQDKILSGEIPAGTLLPSERELAEQIQVSRAVVNAGLAELAKHGFLDVQPRKGTFVTDYRKNGNINTLIAIMEYNGGRLGKDEINSILELRKALEHLAVEHAIKRASDEDIERLDVILKQLSVSSAPSEAAEAAFLFHHELALIGKNNIIPLIYTSFKAPVTNLWERFCRLYGIEQLCRNTEILYDHIRDRDLKAADQWTDQYLGEAINGNQQIYYES